MNEANDFKVRNDASNNLAKASGLPLSELREINKKVREELNKDPMYLEQKKIIDEIVKKRGW